MIIKFVYGSEFIYLHVLTVNRVADFISNQLEIFCHIKNETLEFSSPNQQPTLLMWSELQQKSKQKYWKIFCLIFPWVFLKHIDECYV